MSDIVPLRSRGTWQGNENVNTYAGLLNIVFRNNQYRFSIWLCHWRSLRRVSSRQLRMALVSACQIYVAYLLTSYRAFIVQVPITLLAIIFVSISLHLPHHDGSDLRAKLKRIDVGGSIALVATVFFLLFGLDRGGNLSWGDNLTMSSLIACVISLIIFLIIETKIAPEPLAPQRIITKNSLFVTYLSNFFPMASGMSMLFHVSLYFQAVEGKNAAQSGLLLLPDAAGSLTGSLLGGLLVQLSGTYYLLTVAGFIVLVLGRVVATLMTGVVFRSALGVGVGEQKYIMLLPNDSRAL